MNTFEERMKTIKLYIQSCYNKGADYPHIRIFFLYSTQKLA